MVAAGSVVSVAASARSICPGRRESRQEVRIASSLPRSGRRLLPRREVVAHEDDALGVAAVRRPVLPLRLHEPEPRPEPLRSGIPLQHPEADGRRSARPRPGRGRAVDARPVRASATRGPASAAPATTRRPSGSPGPGPRSRRSSRPARGRRRRACRPGSCPEGAPPAPRRRWWRAAGCPPAARGSRRSAPTGPAPPARRPAPGGRRRSRPA